MIRSLASLSLALAFASGAGTATAAERQATVPIRFQGEWVSDLKYCGGRGFDDSRLTIGAERIQYYESGGPIKAVVTQGELELALISEQSGEGETSLTCSHFRLADDDRSLIDAADVTGERNARYRCPQRAK